jgi:hypothetical protein
MEEEWLQRFLALVL